MRIALILSLILLVQSKLYAQSNTSQQDSTTIELDSVVVVGTLIPKGDTSIPLHLKQGISPKFIDAIDRVQGITKIHETGYPLSYRGMNGNRLRIERNGVLRPGVVEQGYLLDDINPENIERIEIVKGIERILYGSGAIGGVIKIDELDASGGRPNNAYAGYSTNTKGKVFGLVLGKRKRHFGIRFSGRRNDAQNFRFPDGLESQNSAFHQNNLALSTAFNNKQDSFNAVWNHQFSSGLLERPQGFQNNPFDLRSFKNRYTYQTDFKTTIKLKDKATLEQRLWGLFLESDQIRNSFDGNFEQLNSQEIRKYDKQSFGYRGHVRFHSKSNWNIQAGADFIGNWLDEDITIDDFLNPAFSSQTLTKRVEKMAGLFSLARYHMKNMTLAISVRGDLASIGTQEEQLNYRALTGGVELTWSTPWTFFSTISLSRQFRYPIQQEAVGVLFGGRGTFFGNPDIQPEFSHQLEWVINGVDELWEYSFEAWLESFNDRITEVPLGGAEFTYENIERARTYGFEGRIVYNLPRRPIQLSMSTSFIRGDNLGTEGLFAKGEPLIGIPPLRLRWGIDYRKSLSPSFWLFTHFNIDRISALTRLPDGPIRQTWAAVQTRPYWLASLKLEGTLPQVGERLSFGLFITNLINADYTPFGTRIQGMGRNINSYVRFSF